MRLTIEQVELWKEIVTPMCSMFPEGVIFATSDREKITWRVCSEILDIPAFRVGANKVGSILMTSGAAYRCMQAKAYTWENTPRNAFGARIAQHAYPVFDGDEVVGSVITVLNRVHPIDRAFNDFAPMIADMFPEGAMMCITSMDEFTHLYVAKKFGAYDVTVGTKLKDGESPKQAIKNKELVITEVPANLYGVPMLTMFYPLFDEEDNNKVFGTFGIGLPRQTSQELRKMSNNLKRGLEEMSAVIQQVAASASHIIANEKKLNNNISDIYTISEDINQVMGFIKQIAEETKMLGLNAAIEAARAGDSGRGFGVVAEEIRKLSDESKGTVVKIRGLTDNIKDKITETTNNSQLTLRSSEEQAAATEEMTASIQEINSMAEQLDAIAKNI